jgi:hypothetical protein
MTYFDLSTDSGGGGGGGGPSVGEQVLLYAVVVVGVIFSAAVTQAQKGQALTLDLSWPWVAVAAFIALITFPAVWQSLSTSTAPLLVRMGLAAQGGAFWSVLVSAAQKAAGQ